ncbi:Coiled-coil protein [Giardia lamblia P15]|uniref:Coiled-coil protein n=1 Tax=Giardia intestinalis (strain P15) TaxID=658858 RepID=E1F2B9_GIAIA|nr:Coiled-coil protein [Giardia lamblia P15]
MFPTLTAAELRVNHAFDKFERTRSPTTKHHTKSIVSASVRRPNNPHWDMIQVFVLDMDLLDKLGDALSIFGGKEVLHIDIMETNLQEPGAVYNRARRVLDHFYTLSTAEYSAALEFMLGKIDDHFNQRQSILQKFCKWLSSHTEGAGKITSINISKLLLVYSVDLTQLNSYMRSKGLPPISFQRMFVGSNALAPYIISSAIVTSFELLNERYRRHMASSSGSFLLSPEDFLYTSKVTNKTNAITSGSSSSSGQESESGCVNSVLLSRISEHIKAREGSLLNVGEEIVNSMSLPLTLADADTQTDDILGNLQEELHTLSAQNATLSHTIDELMKKGTKEQADEILHLNNALLAANVEITALKKQLMDAYTEKGEQTAELEKLQMNEQLYRSDAQRLRENLTSMTKRLEEVSYEVSSLKEDSICANTRLAKEQHNSRSQQDLITQLQTEILSLAKAVLPSTESLSNGDHNACGETLVTVLKNITKEYQLFRQHSTAIEMVCEEQRKKLQYEADRKNALIDKYVGDDHEVLLETQTESKQQLEIDRLNELLMDRSEEVSRLKQIVENYNSQIQMADAASNAENYLQEMKLLRSRLENEYEDVLNSTKASMLSSVTEFTSHKSEEIFKLNEALAVKSQMLEATKAKLKEDEEELTALREALVAVQEEVSQRDELIKDLLIKASEVETEQREDTLNQSFSQQRAIFNSEIANRDAIIAELSKMQSVPPAWLQIEVDIIKKDTASLLTYIDTCDFSKVTEDKSNISRHLSSIISSIAILQQRLEASSRTATAISDSDIRMADNPESFETSEQDNQESLGVVRFQLATNTQLAKTAVHINDDNTKAPSSLASTAKSFDDYVEVSEEDETARGPSGSPATANTK